MKKIAKISELHELYITSVPGHCGIECNMKTYILNKKSRILVMIFL